MPTSISFTPRVWGVIKDVPDRNDPNFDLVRGPMKDMVQAGDEYAIPEYTPISDQGTVGTCGSNAYCDALEILLGLEELAAAPDSTPEPAQLSRLFHAWTSRSVQGKQKVDSGIYLRDGAKQLQQVGVCGEILWPYDLSNFYKSPPLQAYNVASDNKVSGLFRIDNQLTKRCDDVETSVRANHPVVFSTGVGTEYQYYQSTGTSFGPPLHVVGFHAQIIVGVRRRADGTREYKVRNSWSDQWGIEGHAWINEEYLEWSSTNDLWVMTRMEELVQ